MRLRFLKTALLACTALMIVGGAAQAQNQTYDPAWMKTTNHNHTYVRGFPYPAVTDGYWQWTPTVWNGPQQNGDGVTIPNWADGDFWAKWTYDSVYPDRLQWWFKTTVTLPAGTDSPLIEVRLVNKYNPASGPILSINDGIYVWVNGNMARAGGNGRFGYSGDTWNAWYSLYANSTKVASGTATETDFTFIAGGLVLPASAFHAGDNQIDVMTDDIAAWGGLGHPVFQAIYVQIVQIDIKPGSYPNSFNLNGNGVIPVAILGSGTFDVSQIDMSTLSFQGLAVRVKGNGAPQCSIQDVNSDGRPDMVCQFVDNTVDWTNGTTTATLNGKLLSGTAFAGSDEISIVP